LEDVGSMHGEANTGLIHEARLVAVAVTPVAAAFVLGQMATFPNLTPWYAGLVKPAFNPLNWVFAPVWTIIPRCRPGCLRRTLCDFPLTRTPAARCRPHRRRRR
jgi:hypothetical protein